MRKLFLLLFLSVFLLSACKSGADSQTLVLEDEDLYGTWVRQATYVNDVLEHETPATLEISADKYSSITSLCTTSGSALTAENMLTVTMEESNCPAPMQLPFTLTYVYEIAEAKSILRLTVQGVTEEYLRQ